METDIIQLTLQDLPDELLLSVLSYSFICIDDICRVACTCSRLKDITEVQNLWKIKLQQHWPKIWEYLSSNPGITEWRDEVKQVVCLDREVRRLVSGLSHKLYHNTHLSTPVYNIVDALVMSTPYAPLYVKNALTNIIDKGPQYVNLTEKYYALKVKSHVHQWICEREWKEFLQKPSTEQSLERGSMLLARWFQPHQDVTIKKMSAELDDIANTCCTKLAATAPDHPALTSPLIPSTDILLESKWNQKRCRQLFKCINEVLYNELKFAGNSEDYYNLKNSLINEVLASRKGIPITLSIVYLAVCHRLGIRLEPVNFPTHFLVKWKIPGASEYEFINAFDKGRHVIPKDILAEIQLIGNADDHIPSSCLPLQVFQRMIRNVMNVAQMSTNISDNMELYCPATELMSLLDPSDHSIQELLLRIYYTLEIHYDRIVAGCLHLLKQNPSTILEEMLSDCQDILQFESNPPAPIVPNCRVAGLKYATGLVMQHKRYNYSCVIFGWDKECEMPREWVRRMGVDNLKYKTKQPFYNVLVYDGSRRYAAQENLSLSDDPVPISHPDIGKYFKEFTGTHYIPNDELRQQYPDDEPVRNNLLRAHGFFS